MIKQKTGELTICRIETGERRKDMRIHPYGDEQRPVIIMLPGSFCNADTMANIISRLKSEFRILAVDYNGQYEGSEKPFTSRLGEAEEIIRYLREQAISSVALVYGSPWAARWGWSCWPN